MVILHEMRKIKEIILASTMTQTSNKLTVDDAKLVVKDKFGYKKFGFHFMVMQDGSVINGLPLYKPGLFCKGHNKHSIGIVYVGGINSTGQIADTRNDIQKFSLDRLIKNLCENYPCKCLGIDTFKPDFKLGFDCIEEYRAYSIA